MRSLADKLLPDKLKHELKRILGKHNANRAGRRGGLCAEKTEHDRGLTIKLAFAQLWEMGFRLPSIKNLGGRHIDLLMQRWDQENISVKTFHTRLSHLRTFAGWVGKAGMVRDIHDYLPDRNLVRHEAAESNRAWRPNGVDPMGVIAKARNLDERLAVMLSLQHAFGLRVKESIEMRPAYCLVESGAALEIYEGTKGGRLRRIGIDSDYKRDIFAWARMVAASGRNARIRWNDCTWKQARARYYYMVEKLGITKGDLGVTSHGLRHSMAQEKYTDLTGLQPPIAGVDPRLVDPKAHREAGIHISRELGHGRLQVTTAYYGSHGNRLRRDRQDHGRGGGGEKA